MNNFDLIPEDLPAALPEEPNKNFGSGCNTAYWKVLTICDRIEKDLGNDELYALNRVRQEIRVLINSEVSEGIFPKERQHGWTPVDRWLPNPGTICIVKDTTGRICFGVIDEIGGWKTGDQIPRLASCQAKIVAWKLKAPVALNYLRSNNEKDNLSSAETVQDLVIKLMPFRPGARILFKEIESKPNLTVLDESSMVVKKIIALNQ